MFIIGMMFYAIWQQVPEFEGVRLLRHHLISGLPGPPEYRICHDQDYEKYVFEFFFNMSKDETAVHSFQFLYPDRHSPVTFSSGPDPVFLKYNFLLGNLMPVIEHEIPPFLFSKVLSAGRSSMPCCIDRIDGILFSPSGTGMPCT